MTVAVVVGLLLQLFALWVMHVTVKGRWLRHAGAMLLAMAFLYHGFTEIQQWLAVRPSSTRIQATQQVMDSWLLWVSTAMLVYALTYAICMRGRPGPSPADLAVDAVDGLSVKWLLLLCAPLVVLSAQGRGAVQAAGFYDQGGNTNYATAGLALQFLVFTVTLTGVVLVARRGGRWLMPWLILQTAALSFVGVRSMLVVSAVLVIYGAVRLKVKFARGPMVAAILLIAVVAATVSSARVVDGRESFLANSPASARLGALADGFVALPSAASRQALVEDIAYRFDGNTFGALVSESLDEGTPPTGLATLKNDVLLAVPSFLNPSKRDLPIEYRNEDAYFVKRFGLNYGTDYLPGLFGFMVGFAGKPGFPILAALLGCIFAATDRWLLRGASRTRFLISFGLMQAVLFYGQLPAGFIMVARGVLLFVLVIAVVSWMNRAASRGAGALVAPATPERPPAMQSRHR